MRTISTIVGGLAMMLVVSLVSPVMAQEKAEKPAEKAKAQKVSGDIGLLDTEKNYMIVVTKDGKLVTLDYNQKTKVTELKEKPAKMSDIGLGSAAAVEYVQKGDKNFLSQDRIYARQGRRLDLRFCNFRVKESQGNARLKLI